MGTSIPVDIQFHTLTFRVENKQLTLVARLTPDGQEVLRATIGLSFDASSKVVQTTNGSVLELEWAGSAKLTVECVKDVSRGTGLRYDLKWTTSRLKELQDSFHLAKGHWYGGAQVHALHWPIEKWHMKMHPYVAGDSFKGGAYGGVLERYFLSSAGAAVFIDDLVPLFVSINSADDGRLTLSSKFDSPYSNVTSQPLFLNYVIYVGDSLRSVHDMTAKEMIPRPINIPDELLFRRPIWSTWAPFKRGINQQIVLSFADDITKHGFKSSQLEIDDDWTPAYGDMEFDKTKFPNPKQMMTQLKEKGFRVTLWVHPFASIRSVAAGKSAYWLNSTFKGYTTWWNGVGKCLDVTNPAANAWYKGCLQALQEEHGITSYKFDAGEINWLPSGYTCHTPMQTPNEYSRRYAELCASVDTETRALEVRVGVRTQHLPVFVRMMDKQSGWGYDNGLQTIIPHALTFGVIGYPFVLPDMIGGNAYNGRPSKELYIRWMEVNALLPCVQISIPPWEYDQEVIDITRKMLELHEKYSDLFISCAKESVRTGAPIIRPLWWVDPHNETSQTIDNEFLVGDDLLVAPITQPDATTRAVYLPPGKWCCENQGTVLEGGQWHSDYRANIDELPYFSRVKE